MAYPELKILQPEDVEAMYHPETLVPDHNRESIVWYIEKGRGLGSFLSAVVNNDLKGAFGRADDMNTACMRSIVAWLYNHAPHDCWGYSTAVDEWCKQMNRTSLSEASNDS